MARRTAVVAAATGNATTGAGGRARTGQGCKSFGGAPSLVEMFEGMKQLQQTAAQDAVVTTAGAADDSASVWRIALTAVGSSAIAIVALIGIMRHRRSQAQHRALIAPSMA